MKEGIYVKLNFGLNTAYISIIQGIEKGIDMALSPLGFTRTTSTKDGDFVEINYRKYAKAE